jgi:hypothetical protein
MSWLYRLFKRNNDESAITLDPTVAFKVGGGISDPVTISPTDTIVLSQSSVTANTNAGTDTTIGASYKKVTSTVAQTGQIATDMVRTTLSKNVFDAYGVQTHLTITDDMQTTDANAHLTALSAKAFLTSAKTVAKGWINAGLFIIDGAGTITSGANTQCMVVSAVAEVDATAVEGMYHADIGSGATPAVIAIDGADGTGKSIYTHAATGATTGRFKIKINGVTKYVSFYDTE